jgi:hypothetical protein
VSPVSVENRRARDRPPSGRAEPCHQGTPSPPASPGGDTARSAVRTPAPVEVDRPQEAVRLARLRSAREGKNHLGAIRFSFSSASRANLLEAAPPGVSGFPARKPAACSACPGPARLFVKPGVVDRWPVVRGSLACGPGRVSERGRGAVMGGTLRRGTARRLRGTAAQPLGVADGPGEDRLRRNHGLSQAAAPAWRRAAPSEHQADRLGWEVGPQPGGARLLGEHHRMVSGTVAAGTAAGPSTGRRGCASMHVGERARLAGGRVPVQAPTLGVPWRPVRVGCWTRRLPSPWQAKSPILGVPSAVRRCCPLVVMDDAVRACVRHGLRSVATIWAAHGSAGVGRRPSWPGRHRHVLEREKKGVCSPTS